MIYMYKLNKYFNKKRKTKTRTKTKTKSFAIYSIILLVLFMLFISNGIFASEISDENGTNNIQEKVTNSLEGTFGLDEYVSSIDEYVKESGIDDISFNDIASSLINANNIDYKSLVLKLLSLVAKEVMSTLKGAISIFLVIVIMSIISSLELEKDSDVVKLAHLACFVVIATITIAAFVDVISMFKNVISTLTTLMQTISPFLMAVLISTGAITTTGIIQPMLLFLASAIGFIVNYVVIPFFTISVALNVICSISENLNLNKMSKLFSNSSLWIVGVLLTIFLSVLALETNLTTSVDSLAVKTTQSAVSNFVPVVGKFFSDSFESVVAASKIISNVGGTIGIIAITIVAIIPVIKIASIMGIYALLSAIIQPICADSNIEKFIANFADIYKTILGVLIGITILFVISTGLILNLVSSVIK